MPYSKNNYFSCKQEGRYPTAPATDFCEGQRDILSTS